MFNEKNTFSSTKSAFSPINKTLCVANEDELLTAWLADRIQEHVQDEKVAKDTIKNGSDKNVNESEMMEHQIEIYTSPDGSTQIEVQFEGDTF